MKLPGLAVLQSVIVIKPIGNITVLLGFKDNCSTFNSMYCARLYKKEISLLNRYFPYKPFKVLIIYIPTKLFFTLCIMSYDYCCTFFCICYIPAFSLAKRTVFVSPGIGIIRVYLNGKVCFSRNKFGQKRKYLRLSCLSPKFFVVFPETSQSLA